MHDEPDRALGDLGQRPHANVIYDLPLDRCAVHGIWFDREELAAVLLANGEAFAERQPIAGRRGATSAFSERRYLAALAKHIA